MPCPFSRASPSSTAGPPRTSASASPAKPRRRHPTPSVPPSRSPHPDEFVFHGHIRDPPGQHVPEKAVPVLFVTPFPLALGDEDPAHRRVARPRGAEPGRDRPEEPPRLRIRKADHVQDPQGKDELGANGRVEGHARRVRERSLDRKST